MKNNSTHNVKVASNCIILSSYTSLSITSSVETSKNYSSSNTGPINVTWASDKSLNISTGNSGTITYEDSYETGNGKTKYRNVTENCNTKSIITLTYSKDGKTCSGTITVIH